MFRPSNVLFGVFSLKLFLIITELFSNCLGAFVDTLPKSRVHVGMSLIDLHMRCEGLCYYFTATGHDANGDCTMNGTDPAFNCEMIFSILKYEPNIPKCEGNIPYLDKIFCKEQRKNNEIYKITLARKVEDNVCNLELKVSSYCVSRAFVGVAFSTNTDIAAVEDNPFYICTGDEPSVQSWIHMGNAEDAISTNNTTPFSGQAVGVLFSIIKEPKLEKSLICSFYLSTGSYNYTPNGESEKSFAFGLFNSGGGWNVKMARGLVHRDVNSLIVSKFTLNSTSTPFHLNSPRPDKLIFEDPSDTAMHVAVVDKLTADAIANKTVPRPASNSSSEEDSNNLNEMSAIYKDCMEMKRFCYTYSHERGCMHKEMCHVLVAIQAASKRFDRLKFTIISQFLHEPGVVKHVRPSGWAAIGFSVDQKMGDDFVAICGYYGNNTNIYATFNLKSTNLYYKNASYQDLFENKMIKVAKKPSEEEPRVMCSFELTKTTNISITKMPFSNDELSFNFKNQEYFVLLASGIPVSRTFNLSFHSMKEVIRRKFSQKRYEAEVNGSCHFYLFRNGAIFAVIIVLILSC